MESEDHSKIAEKHQANKKLLQSAMTGNLGLAQEALAAGADIEVRDGSRNTSIVRAAAAGNADLINFLAQAGANIESKTGGIHALSFAAQGGKTDSVQALLDCGAKINTKSRGIGITALMAAASNGHIDALNLLIDHGAKVELKDSDGSTALHQAAVRGSPCVGALLERGANIHARDDKGNTPLSLITYRPIHDESILQLVAAGADLNTQNSDGWTPLMSAALQDNGSAISILVRAGADQTIVNHKGETAEALAKGEAKNVLIDELIERDRRILQQVPGGEEKAQQPTRSRRM